MPTSARGAAGAGGAVFGAVGIGPCIPRGARPILRRRGEPSPPCGRTRGFALMAATSVITCPECHKKFKGREELLGKRVRCPNCNHGFIVQKVSEDKVDSAARSPREAVTAKAAPQPGT